MQDMWHAMHKPWHNMVGVQHMWHDGHAAMDATRHTTKLDAAELLLHTADIPHMQLMSGRRKRLQASHA